MLWMLSKRVLLASQYSGQWRKKWFVDSMLPPQEQMGFIVSLKSCSHLCSSRSLKPRSNLVKDTINPLQQLFIFTYAIRCSRLPFWEGFFINLYIFSSIKDTNWLINKGMCVLLFDGFKHLTLKKADVGWGEVSSALFEKLEKSALICGKKSPIVVIYG